MENTLEIFKIRSSNFIKKVGVKKLVICAGALMFVTAIIDSIRDNWLLKKTGIEFCATVNSITEARRGVDAHYSYKIDGIEFKFSSNIYNRDKVCVGCSYFLLYSSSDPEVHEIDLSKKVSNCF